MLWEVLAKIFLFDIILIEKYKKRKKRKKYLLKKEQQEKARKASVNVIPQQYLAKPPNKLSLKRFAEFDRRQRKYSE